MGSDETDELAKQHYEKMRKDDEAAVKFFVKVNQEYSKFRNRQEEFFRLLKDNYHLIRIREEMNNYFTEENELQKLLDK